MRQLDLKNITATYCLRRHSNGDLSCAFFSDNKNGVRFKKEIVETPTVFIPQLMLPKSHCDSAADDLFCTTLANKFKRRETLKKWLKKNQLKTDAES